VPASDSDDEEKLDASALLQRLNDNDDDDDDIVCVSSDQVSHATHFISTFIQTYRPI